MLLTSDSMRVSDKLLDIVDVPVLQRISELVPSRGNGIEEICAGWDERFIGGFIDRKPPAGNLIRIHSKSNY